MTSLFLLAAAAVVVSAAADSAYNGEGGGELLLRPELLAPVSVPPRLFGNNDMYTDAAQYLNTTKAPYTRKFWVPANVSSPFASPALATAVRAVGFRTLRYPGGTVSNFWNISSGSIAANASICAAAPNACGKFAWLRTFARDFPPAAFGPAGWATLARNAGARTMWVLNPLLFHDDAQTLEAQVRELASLTPKDEPLHLELGNELYDLNTYTPPIASAADYAERASPSLHAARLAAGGNVSAAVIGCPCDMFYNSSCWSSYYAAWNGNLSAWRASHCDANSSDYRCFDSVTAHDYTINLSALSAFDTAEEWTLVFLSGAEMSMRNAVARMRQHFPTLGLHVTESNIFFPDAWTPAGAATPAGRFMYEHALSSLHGINVISGVLTALRHTDVVRSYHYHGFIEPCLHGPCARNSSQPGFAVMSLDLPGMLQVSPLGQMYAHFSHLANTAQSASALDFDSDPQLPLAFAGRSHVAPAQGAVFDYAAGGKSMAVILRRNASAPTTVALPAVGALVNSTFYPAAAMGAPSGWSAFPLDTVEAQPFPWPGPVATKDGCVAAAGGGASGAVALTCGQGLYIAHFA